MSSLFTDFLSTLPEGLRDRILLELDRGPFADVDELRASVAGKTKVEITSFLQRHLPSLSKVDVSALAGLLVAPIGNYISLSHHIIGSRIEIVSIISIISFLL
jgi:hypothetical protein